MASGGRAAPWRGHLWTVLPAARGILLPTSAGRHTGFRAEIVDPRSGRLELSGRLHEPPGARTLIVALHGLAGSAESSYLRRFARAAARSGRACLRLNLRGADGGADFYHAGLTVDLDRVLAAPALGRFEHVVVIGFSLGGHTALRWAAERERVPVEGVVAVCAPLDLDRGATALDAPGTWLYRGYLMHGLKRLADAVEERAPRLLAAPRALRRRVRGIREWDGLVVAPRWGFDSAEDYYARASVAPRLGEIRVRSWIVVSESDPMVPFWTVEDALRRAGPATEVTRTRRGGHVGFPADLDLGRRGPPGLAGQLLAWVAEREAEAISRRR